MKISRNIYNKIRELIGLENSDENFLLIGSSQAFIIKVLGLIVAFLLQILLAKILGVKEFGDYIYVLTWINTLGIFTKLGYDRASKKFLSIFYSLKQHQEFKTYVFDSSKLSFVICFSLLGLSILAYTFIPELRTNLSITFIVGFVLLIVNNQLGLISSYLEAIQAVYKSLIPSYIIRPATLIMLLLVIYFYDFEIDAVKAIGFNVIATIFALALASFYFFGFINTTTTEVQIEKAEKKEWRRVAFSLMFVAGVHMLLVEADTILIGIFDSTASAGIYQVAIKIGHLAMFGFSSVEIVLAPTISKMYAEKNIRNLQKELSKGVKLMFILTIPIIIFLYFFGDFVLSLYGKEFEIGFTSLKILLFCQLVNVATGSALNTMVMTKYEKQSVKIIAVALILNIILNILLIPKFGMEGAAWSTGITTIFWNIVVLAFVKRKLKLDPSVISIFRK